MKNGNFDDREGAKLSARMTSFSDATKTIIEKQLRRLSFISWFS